jgi:hypothetical protein
VAARLVVIKRFSYRGNALEEFSNEYCLTGATPADAAAWRTLFDALVAQEKTVYSGGVSVVAGYGYDSESPTAHAVWSVDLTISPNTPVAGTGGFTSGIRAPGDAAVWCRWKTDHNNSKGKPVYLRKYFHDAWAGSNATIDSVYGLQLTALNNFATKMKDGTFLDGRIIKPPGYSAAIISSGAGPYITTRTLKRRGKRPT